MVVKTELKKLGLHSVCISLGEVEVQEDITPLSVSYLRWGCSNLGWY